MHSDKLRKALEELRSEINDAEMSSGPTRDRLNNLITDIERKLENQNNGDDEGEDEDASLLDNVKDAINHLELEHPRATTILNQIMTSLGGIGI